jgi:hypothetical protein
MPKSIIGGSSALATPAQSRNFKVEDQLSDCTMYAAEALALLGMLRTYTDTTKGPANRKVRTLLKSAVADIREACKAATPGAFLEAATQVEPMLDSALGEWANDNGSNEKTSACTFGLYRGVLAALANIREAAVPQEQKTPIPEGSVELSTLPGEWGRARRTGEASGLRD